MAEDKIFPAGLFVKSPREGAPEFVIGSLGIKVDEFKTFLDANVKNNGYVDIDLLMAKSGKPYAALNTYKPEKPESLQDIGGRDDADGLGESAIPF